MAESLNIFKRFGLRVEKLAQGAAYRVYNMEGIRAKAARNGATPGIEKNQRRSPYVFQNKGVRNDETDHTGDHEEIRNGEVEVVDADMSDEDYIPPPMKMDLKLGHTAAASHQMNVTPGQVQAVVQGFYKVKYSL
eukprot:sb/3474728/